MHEKWNWIRLCSTLRVLQYLRLSYLNALGGTRGFTRHAEDAIRLPHRVRLVAPVRIPVRTSLLHDLVLSRSRLPRVEQPLEDEDGADVHADAIGRAGLVVHRHLCTVDPVRGGVRLAVPVQSLHPPRTNLVAHVLSRYRTLGLLLQKVRVDWSCLVADFSRQEVDKFAENRPHINLLNSHWLNRPA